MHYTISSVFLGTTEMDYANNIWYRFIFLSKEHLTSAKSLCSLVLLILQGVTTAAVRKGGLYVCDPSSRYKYKNTLVDVKVDTDSNVHFVPTLNYFYVLITKKMML